mgnify:CR=1 FL=1
MRKNVVVGVRLLVQDGKIDTSLQSYHATFYEADMARHEWYILKGFFESWMRKLDRFIKSASEGVDGS